MAGDGVSADASFQAIQGQLTGIQGQLTGIGKEVGEIRTQATEARVMGEAAHEDILELKKDVRDIHVTLRGNGSKGLVRRVDLIEDRQNNPRESTQALEAVAMASDKVQLFKWETIKDLGNKLLKVLAVLVLILLGYDKAAAMVFGVPTVPESPKHPTVMESHNSSDTAQPIEKISPIN